MGKRQKREDNWRKRLNKALEKALSTVHTKCKYCNHKVTINALDGYTICVCGQIVYRP